VVEAVRGWCDACVHGATGDASKFTNMDLQVDNLYAMGFMVSFFGVGTSLGASIAVHENNAWRQLVEAIRVPSSFSSPNTEFTVF
jgi:hypothetical protein